RECAASTCRTPSSAQPPSTHPAPPSFPTRRSSDLARPLTRLVIRDQRPKIKVVSPEAARQRNGTTSGRWPLKATAPANPTAPAQDRKSTRLNSSHVSISYAVFCLKKKTLQAPRNDD